MFKAIKKLVLPSALLAMCLGGTMVSAETATIIGGSLTATSTPMTFSDVTLDLLVNQTSTAIGGIQIDDERGNAQGWSYSVSATDFVSTFADPSDNSGDLTVAIPISAMKTIPTLLSEVAGQAVDPTYGPLLGSSITMSTTPQSFINASSGYGMGSYAAEMTFILTIPKTIPVVETTAAGSKYTAGDVVGIFAGTYTSTFAFTAGAGL